MMIPVIYYLMHYLFPLIQNMTPGNYKAKIVNNISEFMHSNWMTKSYYSSPKHKKSAS